MPFNLCQNDRPKLIDVFLFYNEIELLKARLDYLGPSVDHFIISEANIDFAGKHKNFLLSNDLVKTLPYSKKIIYHREMINLKSMPWIIKKLRYQNRATKFLWKIQDAQRNSTLKPLKAFQAHDIIIFSDLDEFPSSHALEIGRNIPTTPKNPQQEIQALSCNQIFFYYNTQFADIGANFQGSIFTNLATFRSILPHKLRSMKSDLPKITNGGWHFSYFMDENKILNKINAISDVENLSHFKQLPHNEIQKKILLGLDLYDRGIVLTHPEQYTLPQIVLMPLKKHLPNCTDYLL